MDQADELIAGAILEEVRRLERDIAACRWWEGRKRRQLRASWVMQARLLFSTIRTSIRRESSR